MQNESPPPSAKSRKSGESGKSGGAAGGGGDATYLQKQALRKASLHLTVADGRLFEYTRLLLEYCWQP